MSSAARFDDEDEIGFDDLVRACFAHIAWKHLPNEAGEEVRLRWPLLLEVFGAHWDPLHDEPPSVIEYTDEHRAIPWLGHSRDELALPALPPAVPGSDTAFLSRMLERLAMLHELTGDPYTGILAGSLYDIAPSWENKDLLDEHTRARRALAEGLGRSILLRLVPECWGKTTTKAHLVSLGLPENDPEWDY